MEVWREELYHFGIPGMGWGKRNGPPYPLGKGDHSAKEMRKGGGMINKMIERRVAKKRKKRQLENVKKMQEAKAKKAEERKKAEEFEKEKQRVLREGSAEEVMKYQGKLTNQELNEAYNRLNSERLIRGLITKPEQVSTTPVNNFPQQQISSGKSNAEAGLKSVGKQKVPKKKLTGDDIRKAAKQLSDDANTAANLTQNMTKAAKNTVFAINTGISIYNAYAVANGKQTRKKIKVDWSRTSEGGKKDGNDNN